MTLPVRVHRGGLSGRYFAVTSYKVIDAERDLIEARTKHDVTADVEALIAERLDEYVPREQSDALVSLILDDMSTATNRDLACDGDVGDEEAKVWRRIEEAARAYREATQ
jgi:hypothetical protein